jgi:hypothetical protein
MSSANVTPSSSSDAAANNRLAALGLQVKSVDTYELTWSV